MSPSEPGPVLFEDKHCNLLFLKLNKATDYKDFFFWGGINPQYIELKADSFDLYGY